MNAVHNVKADLPIAPTGRNSSKPVSVSFHDIRDSILKSRIDNSAPAKTEAKDSETAAEQGMTAVTTAPVGTDTAANADQDALQAADALQKQISKCCDFTELTGKIADILEGFGLLKSSGNTVTLTLEGITLLEGMMNRIMNAQNPAESNVLSVAGNEAGMLSTAIPEDAQQKLQLLINEYVCSLENANNIDSANSTAMQYQAVGASSSVLAGLAKAPASEAIVSNSSEISTPKLNMDAGNAESIFSGTNGDAVAANSTTAHLPSAEQKNPLAQLMQALAAAKGSDDQEAGVQPQKPTAGADMEPAPALGSMFSLRQPELVHNAKADLPFPVVTQMDMAENISNIVEEMTFRSADDVKEFSVSLKPAHLGELVIKLTKGPEGLLAQIKAADASTRGLIQNEVATLTEQLKGKGIEIRQIEVLYEAPSFTMDPRQNEERREAAGNPYKSRHYRASGIEEAYGMTDTITTSALLSSDSSVEYQA